VAGGILLRVNAEIKQKGVGALIAALGEVAADGAPRRSKADSKQIKKGWKTPALLAIFFYLISLPRTRHR
jgi:hypothetical protein